MLIAAVLVTTAAMVMTPMTVNAQGGNATILTGQLAPSGDEQVTKGGEQQIITAQEFFVLLICPDGATTIESCQQFRVDVR